MARLFVVAVLVSAILLNVPRADAGSKGGDVLWEDHFGVVEVAASDGRVAAVGTIANPTGSRTSVVRVYDADKRGLLWQERVVAESVVVDGNRAVVAGGNTVRGYDAKKGRLEWQNTAPFVVTQLYRDEDTTLATALSGDGTAIRIRVYDTKRGTVLVQDRTLPLTGPTTFSGGRMFTAGVGQAVSDGFRSDRARLLRTRWRQVHRSGRPPSPSRRHPQPRRGVSRSR